MRPIRWVVVHREGLLTVATVSVVLAALIGVAALWVDAP